MQRRAFLRATLLTAGGLVVGCSSKTTASSTGAKDVTSGSDASDIAGTDAGNSVVANDLAAYPQSVCSGDPRPDGVILWTRYIDPGMAAGKDAMLTLEVATDADFKTLVSLSGSGGQPVGVQSKAVHDFCAKARLTGLKPATLYYYRFSSPATAQVVHQSPIGRFKTAPEGDADVAVKFAVASCQDFNGKYYNTYARLNTEDLDFFIHLGDYIYETTGNPSFQDIDPKRRVTFTDTAGAIAFNVGTKDAYFAAQSLSNYRDCYKTYRGDPDIQKMHERTAMIAVGDDHEFSDDCWGQTATYFDGAQDEFEPVRRGVADQAWFEYMPVDFPAGPDFEFDPAGKFPDNLRSYRDFAFGKHVHLVMTDLRRYRSDHCVPEDAAPGAVAVNQEQFAALPGGIPALAVPYFDLDADLGGKYGKALVASVDKIGGDPKRCKGLFTVPWVNDALVKMAAAGVTGLPAAIADADTTNFKKGMGFHQMFKTSWNSSLGSRYFLLAAPFRLYAAARWAQDKLSQTAMGDTQEAWFLDKMQKSAKTWKLWGNEYTMQPRIADLSGFKTLPAAFKQKFLLSAEDWDGLPDRREVILKALGALQNVVILSGDIHAFFAGTPMTEDGKSKVVEFVGGAISSGTYQNMLLRQASSDPALNDAGAPALAMLAGDLLLGKVAGSTPVNANLGYDALDSNGAMLVQADGKQLAVTFLEIDSGKLSARLADADIAGAFTAVEFKVDAGAPELFQKQGGAWKKWNPATFAWE